MKIGIVAATYHEELVEKMIEEAEEKAAELDADTEVYRVSGAFDTPLIASELCKSDRIDAVAVLGAIIEGDTDHDSVIGETVGGKLQDLSVEYGKPVSLGISGPGMTPEEAYERTDYGAAAVEAAVETVETLEEIE